MKKRIHMSRWLTAIDPAGVAHRLSSTRGRRGKVLVMFAIILPVLIGMIGLVVDTSMMMVRSRNLQGVADMASTAAATDLLKGETNATAIATVNWHINRNHLSNYTVTVNIPPLGGTYAGNSNYVEVIISQPVESHFIQILGAASINTVRVTSVAGFEPVTTGAAVVVLESNPPLYTIAAGSPLYSSLPASSAGLVIGGTSTVTVDGAVLVNTDWGAVDENNVVVGIGPAPPYGIKCDNSALLARDIRVSGGVNTPSKYQSYIAGDPAPLKANRYPVPDPFEGLPVPTTSSDSANVVTTNFGGVVLNSGTLAPGVYDWIDIDASNVGINPGIYIIRSVNPTTGLALYIRSATKVTAEGIMFYITDSATYDTSTGLPDANDGETSPGAIASTTLLPSVVIDVGSDSGFSGLNSPLSPFDGMLIYQRRHDRRPIIIRKPTDNSTALFSGCLYSKWGHVIFADVDSSDIQLVAGSMRIINLGNCRIAPIKLLPPAEDVFIIQ